MTDLPDPDTCPLDLEGGRPRMPAIIVYVILLLRGWIGGLKSTEFRLYQAPSLISSPILT